MTQLDRKIKEMYRQEAEQYMPPETMKSEIEKRLETGNGNLSGLRGMRRRTIVILAVVILLLASLTCAAAIRKASVRGYANATPDVTDYEMLDETAANEGYPIKSVETFSNGYTFEGLTINHYEYYDAQNQKVSEQMISLRLEYSSGDKQIELYIDQPQETPIPPKKIQEEYNEEGVTVVVTHYTHMFVPEGYEFSEEERQMMADGILGTGTDSTVTEPEISHTISLHWEQNSMSVVLFGDPEDISVDELKAIAAEWIAANR